MTSRSFQFVSTLALLVGAACSKADSKAGGAAPDAAPAAAADRKLTLTYFTIPG